MLLKNSISTALFSFFISLILKFNNIEIICKVGIYYSFDQYIYKYCMTKLNKCIDIDWSKGTHLRFCWSIWWNEGCCVIEAGDSHSLLITAALNMYEVEGVLGRGQFSIVCSAKSTSDNKRVALKKIHIPSMSSPKARADCLKEINLLQVLF